MNNGKSTNQISRSPGNEKSNYKDHHFWNQQNQKKKLAEVQQTKMKFYFSAFIHFAFCSSLSLGADVQGETSLEAAVDSKMKDRKLISGNHLRKKHRRVAAKAETRIVGGDEANVGQFPYYGKSLILQVTSG